MKFNRRHFLGGATLVSAGLLSPRAFAAVSSAERPALLPRAMAALNRQHSSILHRDLIGIVDFAQPSREQRLQIVDVANGRVAASFLVAHGKGSDPANSGWATRFSNRPGSNASCEGSFLTGDVYYGKHGRSRRLEGLDPDNSLALERGIVIHGAAYVDEALARSQGRIGRSLGCFAVRQDAVGYLLDRLGSGRLLFVSK